MSLSAKRSYKFIAIFLCFCLFVCMMPRPDAHAIAGIDDVAILGAGVVGILVALMGLNFNSHGELKAACQECWDQMDGNLKNVIISNCFEVDGALQIAALVADAEFHNIWNHVKDFFSSPDGVIELPVEGNLIGDVISPFPDAIQCTLSNTGGLHVDVNSIDLSNVKYLPVMSETIINFTALNGSTVTYKYEPYLYQGKYFLRGYYSFGEKVDLYRGQYSNYFIAPCSYLNYLFLGVFAFGNLAGTDDGVIPTLLFPSYNYLFGNAYDYNDLCIDSFDFPKSVFEVSVSSDPVIPVDPVYDALVEKSTSADGISLSEDSPTFIEIFGDIADDVSSLLDQVQTLTDTAVLEAVDEAYYTDPADDSVPRLPFLPGDFSGFGSIWHYVEEWLASIGGFISLILNVWSSLPYIIVVPVYASVVLILIFGVYRKFIA